MTAPLAALIEEVLRPLAGGDLPVRLVVWGDRAPGGFMLNDSGTDFSRDTARAAPTLSGRHPFWIRRSTIAPTIAASSCRARYTWAR